MAAKNIFLSTAILFLGNTFNFNVSFISYTTLNAIQKKYFFPAIHWLYATNRQLIIDNATKTLNVDLLGDGRSNSPNYNDKYGTTQLYTKFLD